MVQVHYCSGTPVLPGSRVISMIIAEEADLYAAQALRRSGRHAADGVKAHATFFVLYEDVNSAGLSIKLYGRAAWGDEGLS